MKYIFLIFLLLSTHTLFCAAGEEKEKEPTFQLTHFPSNYIDIFSRTFLDETGKPKQCTLPELNSALEDIEKAITLPSGQSAFERRMGWTYIHEDIINCVKMNLQRNERLLRRAQAQNPENEYFWYFDVALNELTKDQPE